MSLVNHQITQSGRPTPDDHTAEQGPTPLGEVDLNQPLRNKTQPEMGEPLKHGAASKGLPMPKQLLGHSGGGHLSSQQQENSQPVDSQCEGMSQSIVKPLNIGKRKSAALDKENRVSGASAAQLQFEFQNAKPAHKKKRRQRSRRESPKDHADSRRHDESPASEGSRSSGSDQSPRGSNAEQATFENPTLALARNCASKQVKEYAAVGELPQSHCNKLSADFTDLINREKSNGDRNEFAENQSSNSSENTSLESIEAESSDESTAEADPSTDQLMARKQEIETKLKLFQEQVAAIEKIKSAFYNSINKPVLEVTQGQEHQAVAQLESETEAVKRSIKAIVQKFYGHIPDVQADDEDDLSDEEEYAEFKPEEMVSRI